MVNSPAYSISQSKESYQTLKESIQALNITRNKSREKLLNIDQFQDKTLYNEYSVFIEYLSFRIKKYCSQISALYNKSLLDELPCYLNNNPNQKPDKNKYLTDEEKVQLLDDELMNALGDFDEMLLKEDEMIAQTSRKTAANGGNASSGENAADGQKGQHSKNRQDNNSEEESNEFTQKTDKSENNNKSSGKGKGKNKGSGSKKYQRTKLDKVDDDIVARQLKEAAEKETNPALKEKLWDEYYKYKNNKI